MTAYRTGSRDYLTRARALRTAGESASLLYAALELRCGIEARLHEYLKGASKVATVKRDLWQIRLLGRAVEEVFDTYSKAVAVTFEHPETKAKFVIEYTPVTPRLKKIGEILGDFLHYTPESRLASPEFLKRFEATVDEGIEGLIFATRGILLGPPSGADSEKKQIRFMFEDGAMPEFLKIGETAKFTMKCVLVRKDQHNVYLKPS